MLQTVFPCEYRGGLVYPFWGLSSIQVEANAAGFVLNQSSVGTNHHRVKFSAYEPLDDEQSFSTRTDDRAVCSEKDEACPGLRDGCTFSGGGANLPGQV